MKRAIVILVIIFSLMACGESMRHASKLKDSHTPITSVVIDSCVNSDDGYHTFVYYNDGSNTELSGSWRPVSATGMDLEKISISKSWSIPYTIKYDVNGPEGTIKVQKRAVPSGVSSISGGNSDVFKDKMVVTKSVDEDIEVVDIKPLEVICIKYLNVGLQCWDYATTPGEVKEYIQEW